MISTLPTATHTQPIIWFGPTALLFPPSVPAKHLDQAGMFLWIAPTRLVADADVGPVTYGVRLSRHAFGRLLTIRTDWSRK